MANGHGGKRTNQSGRPKKAEEQALIERLSPMDDIALSALQKGVRAGEFNYIKMFFEYRFGKPSEKMDITTGGNPLNGFNFIIPDESNHKANGKAMGSLAAANGNGQGH